MNYHKKKNRDITVGNVTICYCYNRLAWVTPFGQLLDTPNKVRAYADSLCEKLSGDQNVSDNG